MAFVVEDGTGLPNATSYADEPDFVAYFVDEGRDISDTAPPFTVVLRQQALVRATRYIEARFSFKGFKQSDDQALAWPRDVGYPDQDGFDFDPVPTKLKEATYMYALEALYGSLWSSGQLRAPSVSPVDGGPVLSAPLRRESKSIGQISKTMEYAVGVGGTSGTFRPIPAADRLLSSLITMSKELYRA